MEGAERSNHYFMNVKDIINKAFGEFDGNVVNFRLIRIILYLLARQLRILERRVEVNVPIGLMESTSSFSVTEVKVHAITKKITRRDAKRIKQVPEDSEERSSISRSSAEDRREGKKDYKESKKDKESRDYRDGKESKGRGQGKELRKGREGREGRDGREGREGSEGREGRGGRGGRGERGGKEGRYGIGGREEKEGTEGKEGRGGKERRAGREEDEYRGDKDSRDGKKSKEREEGKGSRGDKSGRDRYEDKESKDRHEHKEGREAREDKKSREGRTHREGRGQREDEEGTERQEGKSSRRRKVGGEGKEDRESSLSEDDNVYSSYSSSEGKGHDEAKGRSKDGREGKDRKTKRSMKDSQTSKESRLGQESRTAKKGRLEKESRTGKETASGKDSQTGKESRSDKDSKSSKGSKLDKEGKRVATGEDDSEDYESFDDTEDKAHQKRKERRHHKDDEEGIRSEEGKDRKAASKRGKEQKGRTEGKESGESKETREFEGREESMEDMESKADKREKRGKQRKEGKTHEGDKETESGKRSKYDKFAEDKEAESEKKTKYGKEKRPGEKKKLADEEDSLDSLTMKEKVLRVIHQRADSYEMPDESPTPMASADDMETRHEKILVVESISSEDRSHKGTRTPRMSVVTQDEFMKLANIVDRLCNRFSLSDPEDAVLMEELYKRRSYTEAMAALQLSARLEATEKLLGRMVNAIGTIARTTPGVQLDDETKGILETYGASSQQKHDKGRKGAKERKASPRKGKGSKGATPDFGPMAAPPSDEEIVAPRPKTKEAAVVTAKSEAEEFKQDCVTYMDLDSELRKLSNEMMKQVQTITSRNVQTADRAFKIASGLESKLDSSLDVGPRMLTLESQVATYADQINALDTGLTSQMINYQEQLTQMQHELEVGLEAMAEALTNAQGADTLAVAELNTNFITLQTEQEAMTWQQRDLQQSHDQLATDLAALWKQIELLRDTKSDRDEVTDALRDKAGIKDLNGLVSLEQFDAVRGDLEKRIASAYDKFNNQEIIWQKAIDDMLRELGEKADLIQLHGLRDEINKYLNAMKSRVQFISDIVGEPKAAIVSKKLFRDTICLSCSSPAAMEIDEPEEPPALPKFPDRKKSDAERLDDKSQIKGDGDHKICYPGLPIPHRRHPKAHICTRYCGGSHTLLPSGPPKVPPSTFITPLTRDREISTAPGTDGKMYQVEKVPCLPCRVPASSPPPPSTPIKDYESLEPLAAYEAEETGYNEDVARPIQPETTSVPISDDASPLATDDNNVEE